MAKLKSFFRTSKEIMLAAFKGFSEDRVMKLSAALAYYTLFSITPLIIIIISAAGLLYGENLSVQEKLFSEINELMGESGAKTIQDLVANASLSGKSSFALWMGIALLIVGATTIFIEIQDSINMIWKVKAIPKKGWVKLILNRLISFSLIVSLGFLLIVSLMINSIVVAIGDQIEKILPEVNAYLIMLINNVLTFSIVMCVFAIIFKVLPDVKLRWKTALIGAGFTTLLFSLGKYLIGIYLEQGNPASTFGSAGSVVLILLWVYYTSVILYFGAEFTQAYAEKMEGGIEPSKYAVHLKTVVIEKDVATLPPQHLEETLGQTDQKEL